MAPTILVDKKDSFLSITLNRPEVLNSLTRDMALAFQDALRSAIDDREIRCVLITGAGRGFCAGQDLASVAPDRSGTVPQLGPIVRECYNPIISLIRSIEKPVVCAVNGIAAGAGANLALACDIVIAASHASFVQSFSKVGLIPDSGGTFMLPRLVGLARATAMTFLAEKISASDAQTLGLIYRVVEGDSLLGEAEQLCAVLAAMPTKGLGLTKRALNRSFDHSLDEQLSMEEALQHEAGLTDDYKEGVSAFVAKRPPSFKGC